MMYYLFLLDCAVLALVPLYFVCHKVYQDGVFGRVGLLGTSFAASLFLMEAVVGVQYNVLPQTLMLVTCFAVFLCWHLFRFHCRVLKNPNRILT